MDDIYKKVVLKPFVTDRIVVANFVMFTNSLTIIKGNGNVDTESKFKYSFDFGTDITSLTVGVLTLKLCIIDKKKVDNSIVTKEKQGALCKISIFYDLQNVVCKLILVKDSKEFCILELNSMELFTRFCELLYEIIPYGLKEDVTVVKGLKDFICKEGEIYDSPPKLRNYLASYEL